MNVITIADQFCHTVLCIQSGAYHTRISVGKGRHGVEEVGHMGGTGIHGRFCTIIICSGMTDGDHNLIFQFPYKVQGSVFLWGEGYQLYDVSAALIAETEKSDIRRADMLRRLSPFFLYIYKRTFHINTGDSGCIRGNFHIFHRSEYFKKPFFCQGHRCRAIGGDPVFFFIFQYYL